MQEEAYYLSHNIPKTRLQNNRLSHGTVLGVFGEERVSVPFCPVQVPQKMGLYQTRACWVEREKTAHLSHCMALKSLQKKVRGRNKIYIFVFKHDFFVRNFYARPSLCFFWAMSEEKLQKC